MLDEQATQGLIELLLSFERKGWPSALKVWRQVMIPKGEANWTPKIEKVRPIGIASVLIRTWNRFRTKQIAQATNNIFPQEMTGGIPNRTLEGSLGPLLLQMEHWEKYAQSYCGRAWDFASAFDRVSPKLLPKCGQRSELTNK